MLALSQLEPEWNEAETAYSNPEAYWPINYDKPFEGNLEGVTTGIKIAQAIQLKAVAHLDNQEIDLAKKDYLYSFRINQVLAKNCISINYLIIIGVRAIDDEILWEGLRRHFWSDAQLRKIESSLASSDLLNLARQCFRVERAFSLQDMKVFQNLYWNEYHSGFSGDESSFLKTLSLRPSGWWDEDRSYYSLSAQRAIEALDISNGTLNFTMFNPASKILERTPWNLIFIPISTSVVTSCYVNSGSKIAKAETFRRLARLACRLEEYRLVQGHYPERLENLPDLPAHLNQEVLNEQPLHYQPKGERYLLYSIGWNQKDDGGVLAKDDQKGDWVWPSP